MKAGDRIPDEWLDRFVTGVNLAPGKLRDQLGEAPNLLVFLRYFGCIFCRETLADLQALCASDEAFPRPLLFFQGTPVEGRAFLRNYGAALRAVADPEGVFYRAFGVERGSLVKMFGPGVWAARSRAKAKGHQMGERSGDIWRMPGTFLTSGSKVVWAHEYTHAAELPDYEEIRERAAAL